MLVNCPRCHFSQPNDQYCAQCGVDMQAFKPKEQPFFTRLLQSTFFQVAVLVIAAAFAGQKIFFSNKEPQRWVQKVSRVQSVTKSSTSLQQTDSASQSNDDSIDSANGNELNNLRNKEIQVASAQEVAVSSAAASARFGGGRQGLGTSANGTTGANVNSADSATSAAQSQSATYKIIFAEVPRETLNKWVNEATAAGAYMNLPEYSAGIISDFRKKGDDFQVLKVTEKKLAAGQSDSQFSGTLTENTNQMLGFVTQLEHRITDESGVHGTLTVTRSHRQNKETFPAEFDLPRGAVFVMVGLIRRPTFQADREALTMPPFQIFKSNDFMTQKTEFVFILEPEYK